MEDNVIRGLFRMGRYEEGRFLAAHYGTLFIKVMNRPARENGRGVQGEVSESRPWASNLHDIYLIWAKCSEQSEPFNPM